MENRMFKPAVERESVNGIQEISLYTNVFSNRKVFLFGPIVKPQYIHLLHRCCI